MITVTRLNGTQLMLNPDLIMLVECHPDTVVTLTNYEKFIVREKAEDLYHQFMVYKHAIRHPEEIFKMALSSHAPLPNS